MGYNPEGRVLCRGQWACILNLYPQVLSSTPEMYHLEGMDSTMKSAICLKDAETHSSVDKHLFDMHARH